MLLSPEVRHLCDSFFADTVENNEVFIVKWTFPDAQFPDLSLERAHQDALLADATEHKARELLAGCTSHEDEIILKVLIYYCGYIRKNEQNYWLRFDLNHSYRTIPTFLEKLLDLPVETPEQQSFYLRVLENFTPFVRFLQDKLEKQERMYIRMPKEGCRLVIRSLEDCGELLAATARFEAARPAALQLTQAIRTLADYIAGDYMRNAPEVIGMGQYPGGADLYARQVE